MVNIYRLFTSVESHMTDGVPLTTIQQEGWYITSVNVSGRYGKTVNVHTKNSISHETEKYAINYYDSDFVDNINMCMYEQRVMHQENLSIVEYYDKYKTFKVKQYTDHYGLPTPTWVHLIRIHPPITLAKKIKNIFKIT